MANPKVQPQARLEIYGGMKVEHVKQNGSLGQRMMVSLFDDGDGTLDEREAARFNSFNFTVGNNKVTMYENKADGARNITEITYDNFEEDVLSQYEGKTLNRLGSFIFKNNKGESCFFAHLGRAGKTSINMVTGKVTVENADDKIWAGSIELSVKNSDVDEISVSKTDLKLENTKNSLGFWDRATKVKSDGQSSIKADANSKYETEIEE